VDPSGKFAYVTNADGILGYMINPVTGALTAIAGSPFAAGSGTGLVAVDPSGKFVYVGNSGYMTNPVTGALTAIAGSPFAAGSGAGVMAVDPSGKFAYGVNSFADTVSGYTINPVTGALTTIPSSPFSAGSNPVSVAVDPSGRFAYVTNSFADTVSGYTINPATGALTPIAGSPFTTGGQPVSVAITPLVPFASSFAKLEIAKHRFDLMESFTLGASSNGINPVTENVTLRIGTFSVTIPPGSFKHIPERRFAFEGVINGASLEVEIVHLGNKIFIFKAEGKGVDLTDLTNPVTMVLTIGDDTGSTAVRAEFEKRKKHHEPDENWYEHE
jgi:hypothetical protein